MIARGIRNNNPLNIRRSKDKWQGLKPLQTDPQFCQFETMEHGWRAAFKLLTRTYYHDYRLYTIITGIGPDEPLGIPSDKPSRWMKLGAAMCVQECGAEGLDWIALLDGWALARE